MASPFRKKEYDVIVVGCGNAALSAALSAAECGGSVLVLEKAPEEERGGNTRAAGGNFRFVFSGTPEIQELLDEASPEELRMMEVNPYTRDMYYNDLMRISSGLADPELSEVLVNRSNDTIRWLKKAGVKWGLYYEGMIREGDRLRWTPGSAIQPVGSGAGLVDMEIQAAEARDVEIVYDAMAVKLLTDSDSVRGVLVKKNGLEEVVATRGVVLGAGGFQASPELRAAYLGSGWDVVKVRGTKYNTGQGLKMALEVGAKTTGEWTGCHASLIDPVTGPDARSSFQLGIMVDRNGKRFADEGEDFALFMYVKVGRSMVGKPGGSWGAQIFDQKTVSLLGTAYHTGSPPVTAGTIQELAENLDLEPAALTSTVNEYNAAVQEGEFQLGRKDGKKTLGIAPPKSNWALKLDTPPFVAYPVTTGITFTFGGVQVNRNAQVLDTQDNPIPGLYATGELMGSFYFNYAGGTGLMKGSVFGRIAGAHAMGK
ncbi:MAG: FAD-dependent tricarballylate dehydrogenase TcuA [Chloroflexi bacterium]|nr:FAD-dependent tricarballylate dehydrogenase TcuA [Chloroflexota bacterium]